MAEVRNCAYCNQPVKLVEGQGGMGQENRGDFAHVASAQDGVPNCGRHFLQEFETYTEEEKVPDPSEYQY